MRDNNKGKTLKGKVKSFYITIAIVLAVFTAGICLALFLPSGVKSYAVTVPGTEFSQRDEQNVILSAEKVSVVTTGEGYQEVYNNDYPFTKNFYGTDSVNNSVNIYGDQKYYYKNSAPKKVIQNNSFVMLNNEKYTNGGVTYYRNPNTVSVNYNNLADAVLFTFGTYYLQSDGSLKTNVDDLAINETGANLIYVNVQAWRNGTKINLPNVRTFDVKGTRYQDFAYIIPQKEGYEGYYRFEVDYFRADGSSDTQEFSFYLLFETSYKGSVQFAGSSNTYTSQPTIENASMDTNGYRYYLGKQGATNNYPTITFDYTKYVLSYTHTANGRMTTYAYSLDVTSSSGVRRANLVCTITNSSGTRTITYPMGRYNSTRANNVVTIVLTEMGTYNFTYRYIYAGENASNAPDINNFLIVPNTNEFLYLHGFELKYSKEGYAEAQMRYIDVSRNSRDLIDVIVPNGYEKDTRPSDSALGVMYTLNNDTTTKVGSIVSTQDASVKPDFTTDDIAFIKNGTSDYDTEDIKRVQSVLSELDYQETNQGSLWLSSNDTFFQNINTEVKGDLGDSFYLYSSSRLRVAEDNTISALEKTAFTNQVTFNKPGYYLAFIRVKVNGVSDGSDLHYYQIFAFRYTSDTVEIVIETDNNGTYTTLGAYGYTNKNVRVRWEEEGIFERAITGRYYTANGQYLTREALIRQTPNSLENGQTLGQDVTVGASYLIELRSEGESAVYQMFTIDREDIAGVGVYAVQRRSATGSSIYEFITNNSGDTINVGAISNSLSALVWEDKASGAGIEASYTVTPFVRDNDIVPTSVRESGNEVWFSNNYKLGTTIGPIEIDKATVSGILYKDVLQREGIYVFTLTDKAGNSCKYMFVLDDTEGFFKIGDEMYSRSSLLYTENVEVELGTHKVINLGNFTDTQDQNLKDIVTLASRNGVTKQDFKNLGYYVSTDNANPDNVVAIINQFESYSSAYYLKVRNNSLYAYDHTGVSDANLNIGSIAYNNRTVTISNDTDSEYSSDSVVRRLYLTGENQLNNNVNINNIKSYIIVEVNKDSSLGLAFTSPDLITKSTINNATRLYTWSNISQASATSDNYVAFTWKMGEGKFRVSSVSYEFYTLNTNADSFDSQRYYYTSNVSPVSLYENGALLNGTETYVDSENNTRGFARLNVRNNQTEAGLYIITRVYEGTGTETAEELTQKYYLIVDRNGIIEDDNIRGGAIHLGLLEDETRFRDFDVLNTTPLDFTYYENNGVTTVSRRYYYNLYLTTNKVPATINVPVGKYFDGGDKGSTYYAGRLKFDLFFIDRTNQIESGAQSVKMLFSINEEESANIINYSNGYYAIDIFRYLNALDENLASKFVRESNGVNWLCLPGDYVLRITDMVNGASGNHEKIIGFRIKSASLPTTDIYSVTKRELTSTDSIYSAELVNNEYRLTTSEEFVKVELPKYLDSNTDAQVDVNYLVVEMTRFGRTTSYINYQYSNVGGDYNLDVPSSAVQNNGDGSRTIYLNTFLRDDLGAIRPIDTSERLSYKINIRYKLTGKNDNTRYLNAYYYYDTNGNLQTYYENTYTVIIDRIAPTTNVTNLENDASDNLLKFYKNDDSLFEHTTYENNSGVYFVYQYSDYYNNDSDESLIFAFKVNENTAFNSTDDIATVYYRDYDGIDGINLSLPKTDFSRYTHVRQLGGINSFGSLINNNSLFGKFIEIVEIDSAGNMTQYVVLYTNSNGNYDELSLTFDVSKLTDSGIAVVEGGFNINLSSESANETLTIFDIAAANINTDDATDKFYRFELTGINNGVNKAFNTNGLTDFTLEGLVTDIENMIKSSGQGNYTLRVSNRRFTKVYDINYYATRETLDAINLVSTVGGQYAINPAGANQIKDGVMYYATRVIVTKSSGDEVVFTCFPSEGYAYRDALGNPINLIMLGTDDYPNGTYQVRLVDAFGVESTPYRFRTDGSSEFSSIEFKGENEHNYYYGNDNKYYGYTEATVNYDRAIYSVNVIYSIGGLNNVRVENLADDTFSVMYSGREIIRIDKLNGKVTIIPYYNQDMSGALLEVTVQCMYNGNQENTYTIALDTRIRTVSLRDSNNVEQSIEVYVNTDIKDTTYETTSSGTMSLSWTKENNDYFDYIYTLHEEMKDGSIVSTNLNDETRHIINTSSTSLGLYRFEIRVYTKSGEYLGNKVYVFSVQSVVNELYYVQTLDNQLVSSNSTFTFAELFADNSGLTLNRNTMWSNLGLTLSQSGEYITPNLNINRPLYIYNEPLRVVTAVDQGAREYHYTFNFNGYTCTIYRVAMNTYQIYLATFQTVVTDQLATDVRVTNGNNSMSIDNASSLELSVSGAKNDNIELVMAQILNVRNVLTRKNNLVLEVSYNDNVVSTIELQSVDINNIRQASYKILGNGRYTFVIRDLSGNVHTFNTEYGVSRRWIDVTVLREVVITMNGEAPINNAYFNGTVTLSVYNSQIYQGLVNISVTRNGASSSDDYIKKGNSYEFKNYGTYRVTFSATLDGRTLTKTLMFTIINPNEARPSFDLSSIMGYEITSVLNNKGEDITDTFKSLVSPDLGIGGTLVKYDNLVQYDYETNKLGIVSGKNKFTITYSVEDNIYPEREVTFAFTLNNETPYLESTLGAGESSDKGFTIRFNPGIIYEQIGDAYIYINDELVAEINENSSMNAQDIAVYPKDSDKYDYGEYYVRIVSSSGVVYTGFKVEITKPFNAWAIVVIVVVVVAVVGVTVTIIVLRNKMRIR